jgi:hypothetical protein
MDQHKVPKLSLKHFGGPRSQVWTYDKLTGKCWPAAPGRTGVEAHYYSIERDDGSMDTIFEDTLSFIETAAAPIYARLVEGTIPRGTDREIFSYFLATAYLRSPMVRRQAAQFHKWRLEVQVAGAASVPEAFGALLQHLEADGIDVSDPEFIRRSLLDMSHSDLHLPREFTLDAFKPTHKMANLFQQMKWSLFRAERHYFVTCDNPVYRSSDPRTRRLDGGDGGFMNKTAQITMPLSTARLIHLHWEVGAPREIALPVKMVHDENRKRAYCADREVYAHIEDARVQRLVAEFSDVRPYKAKGSLPGGAKGFGDVIVPRRWKRD